ncbi:hypothetical protein B0H15DRAFT_996309 [Mycena belliarum]|uniref:Uncharacterized protein n=1 Tax=Mycena belliarum TaxID=1033014 RepID=A0AAD6XN01_9AGAR|nr:hypothetical protein B0H15DRAFT_996309 [Mycena belliae]
MSSSSSAPRRLSLHPSALSDAEHTLFTASLTDLADSTDDWEHTTVSLREARAWLCGRYASLGSGTVDQILRLFAPASTLGGGAFFAVLRLVLHAQAGHGVERSLAFVQAPVPPAQIALASHGAPFNPFLPTPAPSPEARSRPPLPPRKPTSPAFSTVSARTGTSSESSTTSSGSAASAPSRRTHHAYSSSLSASSSPTSPVFSPPTHPLRRAATQAQRTPSSSSASSAPPQTGMQRPTSSGGTVRSSNPFRAGLPPAPPPAPPPRRASVSVPASPFHSPPSSGFRAPAQPPLPHQSHPFQEPQTFSPASEFDAAFASLRVHPATPTDSHPPTSPFDAPRRAYPPSAGPRTTAFSVASPPVHPQRRAPSADDHRREGSGGRRVSSDSAPSGPPFDSRSPSHLHSHASPLDARRASASSASSSASDHARTHDRTHERTHAHGHAHAPLPLALPKALRRTLAGAGWVGGGGEREGLVRGGGALYTARNARGIEREYERENEEGVGHTRRRGEEDRAVEAWGAL